MKRNFTIKLIILFIFIFFFECNVFAASLDLSVDKNTLKQDEVLTLMIFLNTEGQSINTLEGDLKYDEKFLKAEAINIGGSFVSFWVEKPDNKIPGSIHFAGVTPGGISSVKGEVFKVVFRAMQKGETNLSLNNVNLFLNDGQGTQASTKSSSMTIKIIKSTSGVLSSLEVEDSVPPEKFTIVRTKDPSIYDNKYFAVFSTIDKGFGVEHYEVCEYWSCITGESPYLLKYQNPFYHIAVRAYDMNGNFTSSTLTSPWLIILLVFLFLFVIIYLCFYLRRNLARK